MAIAGTCRLCGGRVYYGNPDPDNWDFVPPPYRPGSPCPHPPLVPTKAVESKT